MLSKKSAGRVRSLLNQARLNQLPDRISVEDFAELAVATDLGFDDEAKSLCVTAVLSLCEGMGITLEVEITERAVLSPIFVMRIASPEERPHDAYYREMRGDVPAAPSTPNAWLVPTTKHFIEPTQGRRISQKLAQMGFNGEGLQIWLAQEVGTPAAIKAVVEECAAEHPIRRSELEKEYEFFDSRTNKVASFANQFRLLQVPGGLEHKKHSGYLVSHICAALRNLGRHHLTFRPIARKGDIATSTGKVNHRL